MVAVSSIFYKVYLDIPLSEARKSAQLAYIVNPDCFAIYVTRSGHATWKRNNDSYGMEGGWIWPLKAKINFYSGSFGHVTERQAVLNALSNFFSINFRSA